MQSLERVHEAHVALVVVVAGAVEVEHPFLGVDGEVWVERVLLGDDVWVGRVAGLGRRGQWLQKRLLEPVLDAGSEICQRRSSGCSGSAFGRRYRRHHFVVGVVVPFFRAKRHRGHKPLQELHDLEHFRMAFPRLVHDGVHPSCER